METLLISFNKDKLFNRVNVDVLNRGEYMEQKPEMCEHDRAWFDVALCEAANTVLLELMRISKGVETHMEYLDDTILFGTEKFENGYVNMLSDSIERYLIATIINQWFTERVGIEVADSAKALSYLKHVTLLISDTNRKPYYY